MAFDEFPTLHFFKTTALQSNQKLLDKCGRYTILVPNRVRSFKRKWWRDAAHEFEQTEPGIGSEGAFQSS